MEDKPMTAEQIREAAKLRNWLVVGPNDWKGWFPTEDKARAMAARMHRQGLNAAVFPPARPAKS